MKLIIPVVFMTFFQAYSQNSEFTYTTRWEVDEVVAPGDTLNYMIFSLTNLRPEAVAKMDITIVNSHNQAVEEFTILPSTDNSEIAVEDWRQNQIEIAFKEYGSGVYNYEVKLQYASGHVSNVVKYNSIENEFTEE